MTRDKTSSRPNGDSGNSDDECFKKLLGGDTERVDQCLETTRYNLQHSDVPYPMGLIIDTRSPFGLHLVIDMEIAGQGVSSGLEVDAVIRDLRATGQYQATLEKAVASVLEENDAKAKTGDIPITLGIADRLSWEATLRNYAAEVDNYYRENLEAIVAMFKQFEAVLRPDLYPVAIIEHCKIAYLTLKATIKGPGETTKASSDLIVERT